MKLRGDICTLRPWREGDQTGLISNGNDVRVAEKLSDNFPHPYTREVADEFIAECEAHEGPPMTMAITLGDAPVGSVGLIRRDNVRRYAMTIAFWLGSDYWGRGLMSEAVSLFVPYTFDAFPDITRIQSTVIHNNPASARVLEKNGFKPEGRMRECFFKNGTFYDELIFGLLRREHK